MLPKQFTEVNAVAPEKCKVRCSTRCSSGPNNVYMNDTSEQISEGEIHLHADHITQFLRKKATDDDVNKMQSLANETTWWSGAQRTK